MKRFPHLLAVAIGLFALLWISGTTQAEDTEAAHAVSVNSPTCVSCHDDPHGGDVGTSCESCHTSEHFSPSTFDATRHASTDFPLKGKHADVACSRCHTGGKLTGQPTTCNECHMDRHRTKLGDQCTDCHSEEGFTPVNDFDHALTGFKLDGNHAGANCAQCHEGSHGDAMRLVKDAECSVCHEPSHGDMGEDCGSCHQAAHKDFDDARFKGFDHRATGFPLERRHKAVACESCHAKDAVTTPSTQCGSCHIDPHAGQLTTQCEDCHKPDRFRIVRFDHDLTGWPLRGRHFTAACSDCHTSQRWVGLPAQCSECHALDATRPGHGFDRQTCSDCHGTWNWSPQ